jgi:hypothetical protein
MTQKTSQPHFAALAVRSPACCSGESKDQDRLWWHRSRQAGAVCDGVTSSPFSAAAAQMLAVLSASLFAGDCRERIGMLCDVLEGLRLDAQAQPIRIPPSMPAGMRPVLEEVAREQRRFSYQTTLVTAQLAVQQGLAIASVVRCGDSVFLAYSSNGTLLVADGFADSTPPAAAGNAGSRRAMIPCAPGDTLLVMPLLKASDRPVLARHAGLTANAAGDWTLCRAVAAETPAVDNTQGASAFLIAGEVFMAPSYLLRRATESGSCSRLTWSRSVRRLVSHARWAPVDWRKVGVVTDALPDAFHRNKWTCWRDVFPIDGQFILASDGFYGAFADDQALWTWLQTHRKDLHHPATRQPFLQDLHRQLHATAGDDDISFLWIYPYGNSAADNHSIARERPNAG